MRSEINPLISLQPDVQAKQLERTGWMWTVAEKVALVVAVILTAAAFVAMTGLVVVPNPLIPLALLAGGLLARQIVEYTSRKQTIYFTKAANERYVAQKLSQCSDSVISARIEVTKETIARQKEQYLKALSETLTERQLQETWHNYQALGLGAALYQSLLLNLKEDSSIPFTSSINLGQFEQASFGLYNQQKARRSDVFFKADGVTPLTVTAIEEAIEKDRVKELLTPFIAAARQRQCPALPQ